MIAPLLLVVALQSAEVTEPNTQVKFPVQLSAPPGGVHKCSPGRGYGRAPCCR